ncbi:MAG: hypothetical protein JW809_14480 [Pirellulales bacterium]|nr:hypothetical protein [Pirellulales bacterium]
MALGLRVTIHLLVAASFALLARPAAADVRVDAVRGEPFGVGEISLSLPPEALPEPLGVQGLALYEKNGRVLYPIIKTPPDMTLVKDILAQSPIMNRGPVRREVGGLIQGLLSQPPRVSIYFLFQGDAPLELTLQARQPIPMTVPPRNDPAAHRRLLTAWWRQYTADPTGLFSRKPDYPPIVSNYLRPLLARRLGLALVQPPKARPWQAQLEEQLGVFLGTESVRLAIVRERMLAETPPGEASLPLPVATEWPPLDLPQPAEPDKIAVEPIAARVPAECVYVRFGSYANFLWLQDTLKTWGGDLGNLVALRGIDHQMAQRMEEQLVLKQTALGRMLGGTAISDVALIGTDLFFREGAAYGLLFEARTGFLLTRDIESQRAERIKKGNPGGATEEKLSLEDKTVSYISTPDGAVRSYYANDGGYVFVTSSKTLMRRFLQTAKGGDSLGAADEFRHARSVLPLAREDTVFVYLSDAFFRNMAGPHYWIEMARRLQAAADVELVELASLASAAEGKPGDTIDELVAGGFLPAGFGPRPDGSRAVLVEGEARDSLRGRRGRFLPVPDVPIERIAPAEAEAYRRFLDFYHAKWGRLDPMMIGIRRHELPDRQERIVLDVHANPFARQHVEKLSQWIGAADADRLAPIDGDLAAFELQLTNQRLFGGLRDFGLPFEIVGGRFVPAGGLRSMLVGYIGTTGQLGFLSLLDRWVGTPANASGLAGRPEGLWRHQDQTFTVFSLQPDVLATVRPRLRFEPAERPAQIRLGVGDVASARLTPALNTLGYLRTRDTSLGNLRLLHALDQQLHVPGADCLAAAELLLDARLICPLGGTYEFRAADAGHGHWTSTRLDESGGAGPLAVNVPEGYQTPPLNWFRGLALDATMTEKDLSAHVEVIMQLPESPVGSAQ